ncbi:MAG: hypothetical protein J07HQW2_00570 [Haloquadratum walsbyi J07HQW2]|jgi:hypothetical protein|uniref:Uncharacterized protein n=3 Tax=Haloquadratum walsbyi TaxID=293091 RepID=U1PPB0_9EURY|nr:MAG: hypothetical protein J07HQW2_00570 [Haloquadratum walsbyi J07HQW2]
MIPIIKMERNTEQIDIESIFDPFNYIAEIYATHLPSISKVDQMQLIIHTAEVDSTEEYLDLTTANELVIDAGEAEPLLFPFNLMATIALPGYLQDSDGGRQRWITADQTANIELTLTNHELGSVVDGSAFPANNVKGIVLFDNTGTLGRTHRSVSIQT